MRKKLLQSLAAVALVGGVIVAGPEAAAQVTVPNIGLDGGELATAAGDGVGTFANPAVQISLGLFVLALGVTWIRRQARKGSSA